MAVSHVFSNTVANATGTVTIWNGATTSSVFATDLVRPGDWNSAHNQLMTISGNTAGSSTMSGTNIVFGGTNGISLSASSAAGAATMWISGWPHVSFYQNVDVVGSDTQQIAAGSISIAVMFEIAAPISASFIRIPCSFDTAAPIRITSAASLSASANFGFTFNAVVYSLGTGGSSESLFSVASGSAGGTFLNSISVAANGSQMSITQEMTFPVQGDSTTFSTQYSLSSASMNFTNTWLSANFSGRRFLDIPFDNSLSPGRYWLVLGHSTSTATNSTGMNFATANRAVYWRHHVQTQPNTYFGIAGSTNLTSGGNLGAGAFSTAGGGTTSAFPLSAISSSGSLKCAFQLVRLG